MDVAGAFVGLLASAAHELALFAACGFLILGLSDLIVDAIWIALAAARRTRRVRLEDLVTGGPVKMAMFIPAWDEAEVIGPMLTRTLAAIETADCRLYVGCYANDPATIAAAKAVADPRVRIVIGDAPGPTTKAANLNRLWHALLDDEAGGDSRENWRAAAIILHDAEDVVHSGELPAFAALIARHAMVQLPVLPLVDPRSRWIGGTYADEFAEAHNKELVVRGAIGASIPGAGVGCAFAREALERVAAMQSGAPFGADSLTEDYELGLTLHALGERTAFVRATLNGRPIVTRALFPPTLKEATAQKSRWIAGIALLGWDRLGWHGGIAEIWMRLRDRQPPLAALFMITGYAAMLFWLLAGGLAYWQMTPPAPASPSLQMLLLLSLSLLAWRAMMRASFVASAYGVREALRAIPRMAIGNFIAIFATAEALTRYRRYRRDGALVWGKTRHSFPAEVPAE